MALAERLRALEQKRIFPNTNSHAKNVEQNPTLYTQAEVDNMLNFEPANLRDMGKIETPVGTWTMDGDVTIFDAKTLSEISKITKESRKQKIKQLVIKIANMS